MGIPVTNDGERVEEMNGFRLCTGGGVGRTCCYEGCEKGRVLR